MEGHGLLMGWKLAIQGEHSLLCPGGKADEAWRVSWPGPSCPCPQGLNSPWHTRYPPQQGTSSSVEDACRSSASAFLLEKLMMRVILRPAALLIEPFSSARLLFFPLPVAAEMGQSWGESPKSQVYPPLAFPESLSAYTQGLGP